MADDSSPERRRRCRSCCATRARSTFPPVAAGALFVAFASAALLHAIGVQHSLGKAIWAVVIIAVVLAVGVGPWVLRLGHSLSFERAARIREQERAELAAHLHDSVLQTLALIQKRADDPREVAGLARHQERELRSWLCSVRTGVGGERRDGTRGRGGRGRAAARVPIEVVTVGDGPLNAGLEAIVQAAREAMTNAAKFAGSGRRGPVRRGRARPGGGVRARSRRAASIRRLIPPDRRGPRIDHRPHGAPRQGRAAVRSRPGEGTEVELRWSGRRAPSAETEVPAHERDVEASRRHRRRPRSSSGPASARARRGASTWSARRTSVDQAIELIRERRPDVVLLDVHMPDGGGSR